MTLEIFKSEGKTIFGDSEFRRLSREIAEAGRYFNEQILVVGWGGTPHAIILYECGTNGDSDHHLTGLSAIGTGSEVALSTMMFLGQARHSSLTETLYAVAAAKFASEKSEDESVGKKTSMCVVWPRTDKDDGAQAPSCFSYRSRGPDVIRSLESIWSSSHITEKIFVPVREILNSLKLQWQPSSAELNALLHQADSAESKE